jgi:hypothetical protein
MALWFVRGLRRGVVTTRYPRAPDPSALALPTPPAFDPRLLTPEIADDLAARCPSGALARREDVLLLDLGTCTACGRCIAASGGAARPSGSWDLAATEREHLVKTVPIDGRPWRLQS